MAADLLTVEGREGAMSRVYRHDAESLYWVLIWILACFRDGKLRGVPPEFELWKQPNWHMIVAERTGVIRKLDKYEARREEIFSGIDPDVMQGIWFYLRVPFDFDGPGTASRIGIFRRMKDSRPNGLMPKEKQELDALEAKLAYCSSVNFIRDVVEVDYFAGSREQEKAYELLEKKSMFDEAIEACPAPRSI
ncbi:hypothetical protein MPER_00291 [Moniliophthora perniciosa FA553]|nr:hypothetical protein MPER_00291 [Moniliophthora perniciosa FA553]